jgi:hypothetical protein
VPEQWAWALPARELRRHHPTSSLGKEASQAQALGQEQSVAPRAAGQVVPQEASQAQALGQEQSVAPRAARQEVPQVPWLGKELVPSLERALDQEQLVAQQVA